MNIGIGLPAAVPGTNMQTIGRWAAEAEAAGFSLLGVIDRLLYENLDPLIALAGAAATTDRIELMSTVTNVSWRENPRLLGKQLASVAAMSGGRFTAGLGMGGWPADYVASGVQLGARRALFEQALAIMDNAWGVGGPRPPLLLGGTVERSLIRAASPLSSGWVAPLFGLDALKEGAAVVRSAWERARRAGRPRIVTGRYFSLGEDADAIADEYIRHYYGDDYFEFTRADTYTDPDQLQAGIAELAEAGCDELLLFPCSGKLEQIGALATSLSGAPSGGLA